MESLGRSRVGSAEIPTRASNVARINRRHGSIGCALFSYSDGSRAVMGIHKSSQNKLDGVTAIGDAGAHALAGRLSRRRDRPEL
jgi:hypothetical protein